MVKSHMSLYCFLVGILWAIRIVSVDPKVLRHLLFTNYILPLYHKCLLAALKLILYDKHLVIAREQIWGTNKFKPSCLMKMGFGNSKSTNNPFKH